MPSERMSSSTFSKQVNFIAAIRIYEKKFTIVKRKRSKHDRGSEKVPYARVRP